MIGSLNEGGDGMEIMVNGEQVSCKEGISVEELVVQRGHDTRQIAVEWNEKILSKELYGSTVLKEGDVVEIVTFMGGGC